MISRIDCACGNFQSLTHARTDTVQDSEWETDGWERWGEIWKCWQCLGKPMPAALRDAIRGPKLDELADEPEGTQEDALDYLDRITRE
jgi:hypothetical protein